MGKIHGLNGVISGKLGNNVLAVRNGMQIVRQYNPYVANPKSEGQVAARAKLKLMSQLAAVMGPYIAIPKQGVVSARNLFVKKNYPLASYANNEADITLASVELTDSVVGFPGINATRDNGVVSVTVATNTFGLTGSAVSRVVYIAFAKQSDGDLRFQGQAVATSRGDAGNWPVSIYAPDSLSLVVYGYAVRDNTDAARIYFGNMEAPTAETIAKLVVSKVLLESDITLTETKGIEVAATE